MIDHLRQSRPGSLIILLLVCVAIPAHADLRFVQGIFDGQDSVRGIRFANAAVVSPDGRHVYVGGDEGVGIFERDVTAGTLTGIGAVTSDSQYYTRFLHSLALSPDGTDLYAANDFIGAVVAFRRDQVSGSLSFVDAYLNGDAGTVVVSSDGAHVYATTSTSILTFRRNATDGRLTFLTAQPVSDFGLGELAHPLGLALSPAGTHAYVSFPDPVNAVVVLRRAVMTGTLTFVQTVVDGQAGVDGLGGARHLVVSPDGRHLYVATYDDNTVAVFRRDATDGTLTFVEAAANPGGAWIAISPEGGSVYVTTGSGGSLVAFGRDAATGQLSFRGTLRDGEQGIDGLGGASGLAVSPNAAHVYVASREDSAVAAFRRDTLTGDLQFLGARFDGEGGVHGLNGASAVAVSPDAAHVYVASTGIGGRLPVFRRDALTGVLTLVAAEVLPDWFFSSGLDGITVSPDGAHVYVASAAGHALGVFQRAPAAGALTFVQAQIDGRFTGLDSPRAVTVSADGADVYAVGLSALGVFRRDAGSGELQLAQTLADGSGGVDGLVCGTAVALSPDGAHVYVASPCEGAVACFRRDAGTGLLTFIEALMDGVGGVSGVTGARGVAVSPDGAQVYVASGMPTNALVTFSRAAATGRLTFVDAQLDGADGVDGLADARAVAVSPDGLGVYVTSQGDRALAVFRRDPGTGALEFVQALVDGQGGVAALSGAEGVTVSPDGGSVYVAASADNALAVFQVRKPVGSECVDDGDCESGSCTEGVCCTLRCGAPNDSCVLPGYEGVCVTRCVGDCSGDYEISQADVLAMLPRALGTLGVAGCDVGDGNNDGRITVDEILAAVQNAQTGCRPDVSGVWRQDQGVLESSTCVDDLTAVLQATIDAGGTNCDYALTQQATVINAVETCAGPDGSQSFTGTVDDAGQLAISASESEPVTDDCTLSLTDAITADARVSQTPATHNLALGLTGNCGSWENCTAVISARWTRLPP